MAKGEVLNGFASNGHVSNVNNNGGSSTVKKDDGEKKPFILNRISNGIINSLESAFYWFVFKLWIYSL